MSAKAEALARARAVFPGAREKRSCWSCVFQRKAGSETLFGKCAYFERLGKPQRDIPEAVVDDGCKFWTARPIEDLREGE